MELENFSIKEMMRSEECVSCYTNIFTSRKVEAKKNSYVSNFSFAFISKKKLNKKVIVRVDNREIILFTFFFLLYCYYLS